MADQFQYVKLPDGSYGKFAADAPDDVIKSAIQRDFPNAFGPQAPAYNPKVPAPPDVNSSGLGAFLTRLASKTADLPSGLAKSLIPGMPFVSKAQELYSQGKTLYQNGGQSPQQPLGEALAPQLGIDAQAVKEDAQNKNYGGLAAETVFPVAQALLMGKLARKTGVLPEGGEQPLSTGEAATTVKNAVNPAPQFVPKYQATLAQQVENIKSFAKEQGLEIKSRADMSNVMSKAADAYKSKYYSMLEQADPYGTLKQMDSRLSEINATLNDAYEKGGGNVIASQAALSAEQRSALSAEAADIRSKLFPEISRRTNIPVEEVAAARKNMGALRYLAEKTNRALNTEQYVTNKADNQPISLEAKPTAIALRYAEKKVNKFVGHPADRAVADVFRK